MRHNMGKRKLPGIRVERCGVLQPWGVGRKYDIQRDNWLTALLRSATKIAITMRLNTQ